MASKLDLILSEVRDLKERFDRRDVNFDRMEEKVDRMEDKLDRTADKLGQTVNKLDQMGVRVDRMEAKQDVRFEWIKDQFVSVHTEMSQMATKTEMAEGFASVHRELAIIRNHTGHLTERVVTIEEFHKKNCV
jgi:phage shock protein A